MDDCCIVTGGAGFIGCALSPGLANQFNRVIALDNLHPQVHVSVKRPVQLDERVELVIGDVTKRSVWDQLLVDAQPSTIIHLAAETGTGQSLTEASRHAHVNAVGTTVMLDALAHNNIVPKRIVLTSSRAVYGEGAWIRTATGEIVYPGQRSKKMLETAEWDFPGLQALPSEADKTIPKPTSIYGATKLVQEHILSAWCLAMGVDVTILRLQNVYGPGQSLINPYTGVVTYFARLAKQGKSIPVYEDGHIIRDFVYIYDVEAVIRQSIASESASSTPYDIGSGVSVSILNLAQLIAELYEAPPPHINGMFRHGDVRSSSCSTWRTTTNLRWAARTKLEDGVKVLCAWIDQQQKL